MELAIKTSQSDLDDEQPRSKDAQSTYFPNTSFPYTRPPRYSSKILIRKEKLCGETTMTEFTHMTERREPAYPSLRMV
jgi:hypothetical protein